MADALKKADVEAVERTQQLFVFNQGAVLIAIAAGTIFYVSWIASPLLLLGIGFLTLVLATLEWAKHQLTLDNIARIGTLVLALNWVTAVVLTLIVPFTFPLGILQILSPVIAAGPVLERRSLIRALVGATILTATVTAIGLNLSDTEIEDSIPEGVATGVASAGVAVMCVPIAMGAWDAHERQRQALQQALTSNALIRDSRRRLVRAADDERRRVERDLHDGAQQQLVSVTMQLRLLGSQGDNRDAIEPLIDDLEAALGNLRDLAHGIYPPLLRSRGLEESLQAAARRSTVAVTVAAAELGRFDADVEAAVYFCVLEALQNAAKHAGIDATVDVSLAYRDGALHGYVADNGPGFDPVTERNGIGLRNMEDRIGAVGGTLTIDATTGTRIEFTVPS